MTIQKIPIEKIESNPYQPRKKVDPAKIEELAKSIQEHTLLQKPTARPTPGSHDTVQLAFGHRRLAAHFWLKEHGVEGFDTMEVDVRELTNEEMFEMAATENLARADLDPIEVAASMKVYRDEFKKTSKQIAALYGLTDSAVRNKIRLLDLPEDWQGLVKNGTITEGAGRELLRFLSLPDELKQSNIRYESGTYESKVKKLVERGVDPRELNSIIDEAIHHNGKDMSKKEWKNDDPFEELTGTDGFIGCCKGCANNVQIDEKPYCLDPVCYQLKYHAWIIRYLNQASQALGIPVIEDPEKLIYSYVDSETTFRNDNTMLETIAGQHCKNLRLVFKEDTWYSNEGSLSKKAGFPHAMIVCSKRNGTCTCQKAYENKIQIVEKGEGEQLTEEELKEIRQQIAQHKREEEALIQAIQEITAQRIIDALGEKNPRVWATMVQKSNVYKLENQFKKEPPVDYQTFLEVWIKNTVAELRWSANFDSSRNNFNKLLETCGLELLPAETESQTEEPTTDQPAQPTGKTLMEVFSEEEERESKEKLLEPSAGPVLSEEPVYVDPDPIPPTDESEERGA
jgi:ParB/RepB/Spo0J family partition protein